MVQLGDWDLIQRFGSALNLNVHFHMLFLDGVYAEDAYGQQGFHRVKAPTHQELNALVNTLSHRVARCPEKRGLLERDAENTWLTLAESEDDVLTQLHGSSVTYRIATGPQQGRKVFTLQTLPGCESEKQGYGQVAKVAGFSLHAGVMANSAFILPIQSKEPDLKSLTRREKQILKYIAEGLSNKLIARKLDIAESTVKVHVKHLLKKLGLRSRVEAAIWMVERQSNKR